MKTLLTGHTAPRWMVDRARVYFGREPSDQEIRLYSDTLDCAVAELRHAISKLWDAVKGT